MEAKEARVELKASARCPALLYANAGEDGYYRVQVDSERLFEVAKVLERLPEPERFGVVSNAFAAVRSGELPASTFLDLVSKLEKDRSRLVWSEAIDALWSIDRALVTDQARPAFSRFVRALVAPTVRRLGWREAPNEPDDDHFLRESVLHLAGDLGEDAGVLARADRLARQWLADSARAAGASGRGPVPAVSNDLARVALPLAAKHGDEALWQQMAGVLRNPTTPEARLLALSGLIAFEDGALVGRTLALVLDGTIKPQDLRYVFPAMALRRASREPALAWLQAHFDEIAPRIPSAMVGRVIASVAGVCEAERVRALEAFFRAHTAEVEGVAKDLRQSVESALRCSALADAQRAATSAWLEPARRSPPRNGMRPPEGSVNVRP
jgi:aminopeptidase N